MVGFPSNPLSYRLSGVKSCESFPDGEGLLTVDLEMEGDAPILSQVPEDELIDFIREKGYLVQYDDFNGDEAA